MDRKKGGTLVERGLGYCSKANRHLEDYVEERTLVVSHLRKICVHGGYVSHVVSILSI